MTSFVMEAFDQFYEMLLNLIVWHFSVEWEATFSRSLIRKECWKKSRMREKEKRKEKQAFKGI